MGLLAMATLATAPATAGPVHLSLGPPAHVVTDDPGGSVAERLREMQALRASGRQVRIRGTYCHSSCTMLLGLPNVCVQPSTVFGFHGPSRDGEALDGESFEEVSRLVAAAYPAPLRAWYLAEARHRQDGVSELRGQDIIDMGIGIGAC